MRVLYIEDSAILRRSVCKGLRDQGFIADSAADGLEGLQKATESPHDIIVLDLMMPGMNGLEVLRQLLTLKVNSRVLILSAQDAVETRIEGLNRGADDYLVKPFAFDELVARIRALVRRRYQLNSDTIEVGEVRLCLRSHTVEAHGKTVDLAPRELKLLELLMLRRGQVIPRADIEACIYDPLVQPMSNVVDASISLLRKQLRESGVENFIATRRGLGYTIP